MKIAALLNRLNEIGQSLSKHEHALALISLGSAGLETDRMDEYSDLDFFVLVAAGSKQEFLGNLDWLSGLCPIAYAFANTADGYKLLFEDGIFCEFAIFETSELEKVVYAPGRFIWKRPEIPAELAIPGPRHQSAKQTADWLIGEALTNLYIGLGRDLRGEKLSAMRFIQFYAVDRLIELAAQIEQAGGGHVDKFAAERRFEQRFPITARQLSTWMQGYERNRESALAILNYLEKHFVVNTAISRAIRAYCQ